MPRDIYNPKYKGLRLKLLKRGDPGYEEDFRVHHQLYLESLVKQHDRIYVITPLVNHILTEIIDKAIREAALSEAQKAQKEADERKQLELGPFFERLERTRVTWSYHVKPWPRYLKVNLHPDFEISDGPSFEPWEFSDSIPGEHGKQLHVWLAFWKPYPDTTAQPAGKHCQPRTTVTIVACKPVLL